MSTTTLPQAASVPQPVIASKPAAELVAEPVAETAASTACAARWFDGRSSQPRPVQLVLQRAPGGPTLRVYAAPANVTETTADEASDDDQTSAAVAPALPAGLTTPLATYSHRQVNWPEHYNPRRPPAQLVADLGHDGSLEIADPLAWHAALAASGYRPSLARRMQTRWPVLLTVLVLAVGALWGFQRFGSPWLATQIARVIPLEWEMSLLEMAWESLDDGEKLAPSQLPPERQDALRARFDALTASISPALQRYPSYTPPYQLLFRQGKDMLRNNAFALPGGTVVMSDGLVQMAEREGLSDDAIVGVLAHELGHVVNRHHVRSLTEKGVLGLGLSLATGDVSGIWAAASVVVSNFSYSRAHEREADCFAFALLQQVGIDTEPLGDMFLTFARRVAKSNSKTKAGTSHLFATHPDTLARAAHFKEPAASGYCR